MASTYTAYSPPRRLQIVRGTGTFRAGQYAYARGCDTRGGKSFVDAPGESAPGERAYLVSKSSHGRGGAVWFSEGGVRFTRSVR